jgi:ABC-2 type transport system ATP-binding protein
VQVLRTEGTRTLIELAPGVDDQVVLHTALETGPVREYRRDVPSLSDLFRHVMTEQDGQGDLALSLAGGKEQA